MLPIEDVDFKITLVVTQRKSDGVIGIEAKFNEADSTLLLQSIAYLLDTAFSGSRENAELVASTIPDVVGKYFDIKEEQEDTVDLTKLTKSELHELIKSIKEDEDISPLLNEVARRGLDGIREGN